MSIKYLLLYITFFSINAFSQKDINQISIGDYFPENYKIGGWSVHSVEKGFSDLDCRAFKINYSKTIATTPGMASDFERNGGAISSIQYFFLNLDGRIVGIYKQDIVLYAGSNGLRKFLNHKKRITGYIKNYPDTWKFLSEHEFSNLERYFAYTVENYNNSGKYTTKGIREKYNSDEPIQVIKLISIKDNQYNEETYLPTSKYDPLYIVGDPNEDFIEKSTIQTFLSKGFLDDYCKSMRGSSPEKCNCFKTKAITFLKENANSSIKDFEITDKMARLLYECGF